MDDSLTNLNCLCFCSINLFLPDDVEKKLDIQHTLLHRSLAFSYGELIMREDLTDVGKLGLRLLEDLTALAAGGSVCVNNF